MHMCSTVHVWRYMHLWQMSYKNKARTVQCASLIIHNESNVHKGSGPDVGQGGCGSPTVHGCSYRVELQSRAPGWFPTFSHCILIKNPRGDNAVQFNLHCGSLTVARCICVWSGSSVRTWWPCQTNMLVVYSPVKVPWPQSQKYSAWQYGCRWPI